jgi:hypothetical protein
LRLDWERLKTKVTVKKLLSESLLTKLLELRCDFAHQPRAYPDLHVVPRSKRPPDCKCPWGKSWLQPQLDLRAPPLVSRWYFCLAFLWPD